MYIVSDSYREKCVSLLIDGEESTVNFIDPVAEDVSIDVFCLLAPCKVCHDW